MKKFSLFLMAMILCFAPALRAADVTETIAMKKFGGLTTSSYENVTKTGTSDKGTEMVAYAFNPTTGQVRGNKTTIAGASITSADDGKNWSLYNTQAMPGAIKKITVTQTATGSNKFQNSMFVALGTTNQGAVTTVTGAQKNTTGTATEFTFEIDETQGYTYFKLLSNVKFTSGSVAGVVVTVTYAEAAGNPDATKYTVTANVNDPAMGSVSGAGEYEEGKTATLTANAKPGYEFASWSNGSTENPLKITLTQDTTISATFQALTPITCAQAAALEAGKVALLNPFDVVYVAKGTGNIYIQDATGSGLIYDFDLDDKLKAGDHVEGFVGVSSPYNGLPEMKVSGITFEDLTVTAGTAPEPTVFATVPTKADANKYVKFENVSLTANVTFTTASATNATMVVNGTNVTLRNSFKLAATLSKDKTYDIVGAVAIYNSNIQIYFISAEEIVPPVVNHTITVAANPAEGGTVTGGGEFEETDEITVKAVANDGYVFTCWTEGTDTVSVDAEYGFEVLADRNLVANFEVLPVVDPVKPEPVYTENILNPFAFGLESVLSEEALTVTYRLNNSKATSVNVLVYNGETLVATVAGTTTIGKNTVEVPTAKLPKGSKLTWSVEVNGTSVETPTQETKEYMLYHPSSVDIDNNPENATFGMLLVNEAMQSMKTSTSENPYISKGFGAGIFAFTPSFDLIPNGDQPGYNGGKTFSTVKNDFAPRRIRISKDGRIFATAQDGSGEYLWEINPENLNEWTAVFQGTNEGYALKDTSGNFIAGTNSGFDVRGEGENLQLLMLSSSVPGGQVGSFKCHTYNLGTATTWSTVPTKEIPGANYMLVTNQSNAQFDKDGGVWYIQHRAATTAAEPGLVHINKDGVEDLKLLRSYTRNAGFRFNHDFSKVIIAGVTSGANERKATIYTVSQDSTGAPVLTEDMVINTTSLGSNLNDFAWDYAGNIYGVSNSNEKIIGWALPYSGKVTTPAASKYAFELEAPAPVEMVGVVKRALQLGETTIILTHEANGTPHIYTVAGDAIAEVSQEGIVAKDADNAGDYLTISDIALTEDGKLVACNYVRNQFEASYIESGYKRGTLHLYVWHDIKGAASIWFESMFTGNSLRGDCGYTMAVNGTVANANILVTAVHNSHRGVRMSHYTVIDSAYVEPNFANASFNDHLFYVGAKFKGASAGSDAATFNEATHGVNYQLNASPLAENNWVMDSEGLMPTEFGVAAQQDPSIVGAVAETLVSKALVGAYYVTVGDKKVMVAPYADAEGKLAGVKLLDITAGFANATLLTTAESLDLTAPVAATGVATTAVVESNGTLTINLIADATIHTMTATIQESPSTNLENNNVQNDIIKFYQNGQIYIMINGAVYNVMGQMVK